MPAVGNKERATTGNKDDFFISGPVFYALPIFVTFPFRETTIVKFTDVPDAAKVLLFVGDLTRLNWP